MSLPVAVAAAAAVSINQMVTERNEPDGNELILRRNNYKNWKQHFNVTVILTCQLAKRLPFGPP